MAEHNPRILIFDSGVGGLSIFAEIRRQLPQTELIFVSDTAGFPYGTRPEQNLIERVDHVVNRLLKNFQPDIMVVACNSASTVVLPILRAKYDTPLVGVVPAIKPASALTKTGVIGLLATPATISRKYTHQLIADFAPNCQVIPVGSSELVHIAEAKMRGKAIDHERIREIVSPFFLETQDPPLDTLVLGCTHFPLLSEELMQAMPHPVQFLDSGDAIARRVGSLLAMHQPPDLNAQENKHSAVFTGTAPLESSLLNYLQQLGVTQITDLDI